MKGTSEALLLWKGTYRVVVQRANEGVSIAIFGRGHRSLGLEDRVDAADCGRMLVSELALQLDGHWCSPRWATSVAISKRRWFLTSRVCVGSPSEAMASVSES